MADERASGEMNSPENKELERELRALVPRAPRVELAKLMYLAGQASLSPLPPVPPIAPAPPWRAQWLWPVSTAIASIVAGWLGVMLLITQSQDALVRVPVNSVAPAGVDDAQKKSHAPVVEQPARSDVDADAATVVVEAKYLKIRNNVIRGGVDTLPVLRGEETPVAASGPRGISHSLSYELGLTRPGLTNGYRW